MELSFTLEGYNGKRFYEENGRYQIPRSVLVRNVMNVLERNEAYGDLSFCEAEEVCDLATSAELLKIYAYIYNDLPCMDLIDEIRNRENLPKDEQNYRRHGEQLFEVARA